jgi:hypothetical protein
MKTLIKLAVFLSLSWAVCAQTKPPANVFIAPDTRTVQCFIYRGTEPCITAISYNMTTNKIECMTGDGYHVACPVEEIPTSAHVDDSVAVKPCVEAPVAEGNPCNTFWYNHDEISKLPNNSPQNYIMATITKKAEKCSVGDLSPQWARFSDPTKTAYMTYTCVHNKWRVRVVYSFSGPFTNWP